MTYIKIFPCSLFVLIFLLTGCAPKASGPLINAPSTEIPAAITMEAPAPVSIPETDLSQFTTQNNVSGNHLANGSIDLSSAHVLDIPLDGKPIWLVSAPYEDGAIFVAIMDDGLTQGFKLATQSYESMDIFPSRLPEGMPPLLTVSADGVELISPPDDASTLSSPVIVGDKLAYIGSNGDLILVGQSTQAVLPLNALVDSRILIDEKNRLVILAQPTDRYDHGVLGDAIEASAIALVETEPELSVAQLIPIPEPDAIEGISAIWADIDNDGVKDIIVTLSNSEGGARLVAFREDGSLLAESDPIGTNHRWRHQIAVADFSSTGVPILVSIRTPHIGGIVEFFEYKNGRLELMNEIKGFSSHSIGSRNLDAALAGDFNNDGMIELLAPDQPHTSLGIVSIDGVIATLPLDGITTTNLSAANVDGKLFVGIGTQDHLRIWVP